MYSFHISPHKKGVYDADFPKIVHRSTATINKSPEELEETQGGHYEQDVPGETLDVIVPIEPDFIQDFDDVGGRSQASSDFCENDDETTEYSTRISHVLPSEPLTQKTTSTSLSNISTQIYAGSFRKLESDSESD